MKKEKEGGREGKKGKEREGGREGKRGIGGESGRGRREREEGRRGEGEKGRRGEGREATNWPSPTRSQGEISHSSIFSQIAGETNAAG